MSETVIRKQLLEHFSYLDKDDNLLSECTRICQDYNVTGSDFFWKWESIFFGSTNAARGAESRPPLTYAHAESIKKMLIDELNARRTKELKEQARAQKRSVAVTNLLQRRKEPRAPTSNVPSKVLFKVTMDSKERRNYRYMYEKISERSEVLDERIDEFGELIREHYGIDELGDPSSSSEDNVVVVGRICKDAESVGPSAKLTEGDIFLESSRMMGSGSRTPLRFSTSLKLRGFPQGVSNAGLFPGAIVALRGRNGGGGFYVVEEILALPVSLPSQEPVSHRSFTMAMACGPYTSDADLEFKYFSAFMERLGSSPPSVLILLGPFIDISHPHIKSGNVDETPSRIFLSRFVEPLNAFLEASPESLVLLEPSIRDILSDHPTYPQCELDNIYGRIVLDSRIRMIPNPCRFIINGVSFGTTSVDVLFHLRNQEYAQRGTSIEPNPPISPESSGTDPLTNTCRQIVTQRSFYPLFPVPVDLSADVNLDVSHSNGLRLDASAEQYAPDVLLLPSKLKQFTKLVDGTWAVNPSFLTKGTYASIIVPDGPRTELTRTMRCEIVKL